MSRSTWISSTRSWGKLPGRSLPTSPTLSEKHTGTGQPSACGPLYVRRLIRRVRTILDSPALLPSHSSRAACWPASSPPQGAVQNSRTRVRIWTPDGTTEHHRTLPGRPQHHQGGQGGAWHSRTRGVQHPRSETSGPTGGKPPGPAPGTPLRIVWRVPKPPGYHLFRPLG